MNIRNSLLWNGFLPISQKEERGGGRTALHLYATRFAIPSIRADIALKSQDFFLQVWQVVAGCNSQCFAALKNHTNKRFGGLRLFKFAGLLIVSIAMCWKNRSRTLRTCFVFVVYDRSACRAHLVCWTIHVVNVVFEMIVSTKLAERTLALVAWVDISTTINALQWMTYCWSECRSRDSWQWSNYIPEKAQSDIGSHALQLRNRLVPHTPWYPAFGLLDLCVILSTVWRSHEDSLGTYRAYCTYI